MKTLLPKFRDCEEHLRYRFPTHRMKLNFQIPKKRCQHRYYRGKDCIPEGRRLSCIFLISNTDLRQVSGV